MSDAGVIRVALAGALGRMGQEALKALRQEDDIAICGLLVRRADEETEQKLSAYGAVYDDPERLLDTEQPDVWVDLTGPGAVVRDVDLALVRGVRTVVGATGYTEEDVRRWEEMARARQVGAAVCPNFAIGALLMMRFAREAARFMPRGEIIELHHDGKRDKPSGTAQRTKSMMEVDYDVPIHSVRLPGLVAHQEVIFGGTGEVLTIRHDSLSRESFMPGLILAVRRVMTLRELVYGLDKLLW
ncbi:4-hydroxy-tetrahydrodipicolinate reductase [Alicyclobacillus mali]|uniref:4-hydroxy-tetrahydrodipicolinate reductase n=1 Tax=Alicyclobacillus mali (ex Roth et al. 2021) TaxID=1123961 RepID=A0ABS0F2E1_9BACL|nr:4-hydroxy-tetrahydrodipicolinate reductase [Alicyclobacillus mali (ex Roth et al. 2021)]MBF8377452.1 4-hydroxy-tetrahydrodipicolinate reductase [Alicyclobacillus mali (ex Roth et al. 2021)]MCL6487420.1 4-hydroxy-tetrahydrodipicolinate reductase [Alicyclobacillus mali (ex Roth et al. 2021)]